MRYGVDAVADTVERRAGWLMNGGFRAVVNYRNQTKKMVMDFTRLIWYKTDGGWMSHVGTVNIGLHGDTQLYC